MTQLCGAVAALIVAGAAQAQSTAPCPSAVATDEPSPSQALSNCPPAEQAPAPTVTTPPAVVVEPAPVVVVPAPTPPPPPPAPPAEPVKHERRHSRVFAPHQVSITTGAGVANYFGKADVGDTVDPGAAWDARVTFGTRSVVALEAAYMGAVNTVDVAPGNQGQLHSNGVDGDVRFQLPTRVQPYVFGGVGYNHMEVRNNGTAVAGNYVGKDDQVTVPAGAGLTTYLGRHLTLDARGTYRFIPDNGITVMSDHHLHQWLAQAHVGYAF
jgi:opacity protein-like surface antigen